MSRLRILSALAAALLVGACSDTQSPTTPESEPAPAGSEEAIQNELRGEWGKPSGAAALKQGVEPQHSPWLCNSRPDRVHADCSHRDSDSPGGA